MLLKVVWFFGFVHLALFSAAYLAELGQTSLAFVFLYWGYALVFVVYLCFSVFKALIKSKRRQLIELTSILGLCMWTFVHPGSLYSLIDHARIVIPYPNSVGATASKGSNIDDFSVRFWGGSGLLDAMSSYFLVYDTSSIDLTEPDATLLRWRSKAPPEFSRFLYAGKGRHTCGPKIRSIGMHYYVVRTNCFFSETNPSSSQS